MRLAAELHAACPEGMFVVPEPAVQLSRTTEFDPDITVARSGDVGGAKLTRPPLLAVPARLVAGLPVR
jgi:hypothetical protein